MNSSQPTDPQISGSAKTVPVVLDAETLKQVAGGVTTIGDPGWATVSGDRPQVIKVPDPGWF